MLRNIDHIVNEIDYAFQPIVNPVTGVTFAVEALIRNYEKAGFHSIDELFNTACKEEFLFTLDMELRRKAVRKFLTIPSYWQIKLFLNYDHRIMSMPNYRSGITETILKEFSISRSSLCLELSEKYQYNKSQIETMHGYLVKTKERGLSVAIDDFGTGFSGLELFYHMEPDYIKIDRFFISDINSDTKKRSFCSNLISLARAMGVIVIAEGVETREEFYACMNLGFDLVQGYFIRKPVTDVGELHYIEQDIREITIRDQRKQVNDSELIERELIKIEPVKSSAPVSHLFKQFTQNTAFAFLPIINGNDLPLGIIKESSLKQYIYSPYGYDLLQNRIVEVSLRSDITKCPVIDINTSDENILSIFNRYPEAECIIITRNLKYHGILTSRSLLNIINEKKITDAREINPLTKLPGNNMITRHIDESICRDDRCRCFIYFDFDNFKPFNDRFGFRQGDRVIQLFSDLLQKTYSGNGSFVGHIGGDDFFTCLHCGDEDICRLRNNLDIVTEKFSECIKPFYRKDELKKGYYTAKNRSGNTEKLPLMSVSAAVVKVPPGVSAESSETQELFYMKLAEVKKAAKKNSSRVCCHLFNTNTVQDKGDKICDELEVLKT
jgi:EAL domain-containing protein (putative c-di-GMP-specific phosphodiesterase class I)/GGDEF domain-containing protein